MNQSLIVKPYLDKAGRDIEEASDYLTVTYNYETDGRLRLAIEALARALSSVSLAVERVAELVVD